MKYKKYPEVFFLDWVLHVLYVMIVALKDAAVPVFIDVHKIMVYIYEDSAGKNQQDIPLKQRVKDNCQNC